MNEVILTKKDIIAINQQFAEGHFSNESSLDYALAYFKQNIVWTKQLAHLVRAILIDHVFDEGNKRSACAALLTYANLRGYKLDKDVAAGLIKRIVLKNIKDIIKIQRMIEDGIEKE